MIVNQLESPPLESDKTQNKKSADQAVQADKKRAWQRGGGWEVVECSQDPHLTVIV